MDSINSILYLPNTGEEKMKNVVQLLQAKVKKLQAENHNLKNKKRKLEEKVEKAETKLQKIQDKMEEFVNREDMEAPKFIESLEEIMEISSWFMHHGL